MAAEEVELPAELAAVLINIETKARTCEYMVGIKGQGFRACGLPATGMVTSHPCLHGCFGCADHHAVHVEAVSDPDAEIWCVQCAPIARVTHIVWTALA